MKALLVLLLTLVTTLANANDNCRIQESSMNIITDQTKSKITRDVNEVMDAIKAAGLGAGQDTVRAIIKRNYGTLQLTKVQAKEVEVLLNFVKMKIQEHYGVEHLNAMAGGSTEPLRVKPQIIDMKPNRAQLN